MLCSLLCRMQRADPQHATEHRLSPQGSTSSIYCHLSSFAMLTGLYWDSKHQKGRIIKKECRVSSTLLSGNGSRIRGHQREGRGEGAGRETVLVAKTCLAFSVERKTIEAIRGVEADVDSQRISFIQAPIDMIRKSSPCREAPFCTQQPCITPLLQRQSNLPLGITTDISTSSF